MKKFISNILIFIMCVIISGCKKVEDDLFVYRNFYEQDISTFNYIITNTYSDYTHIANFIDGLVENDKYGNIIPSIAKSWKNEIVNNKQIWTFYLRNDVYWSDYKGNKYALVTADDFVTTIKYILNYNIHSDNYSLPTSLIENAKEYYNATLIKNYDLDSVNNTIEKLSISDPDQELSFYKNIKKAFDFCESNSCSDNFDLVGIKAINDYELKFTLNTPSPYFLSALSYCSFLPTSEKFIKEVGINNFGTNKKTLLYNGAYILKDYFHSSKIEYTKNLNYWDKDNVFIDKIVFNKLFNIPTSVYTRLAYETGNIDEFYLNVHDEEGWNKYVIGKDNQGSTINPVGDNTYYSNEITDFTSYYLIFNQNRTTNNYSSLTKEEIAISNTALSNRNFRKALIYGLTRETYSSSYYTNLTSTIVPENFIVNEEKDYTKYFINEYASKNNLSIMQAEEIIKNHNYYNQNLSLYYLNLALEELSLIGVNAPIKIEFSYFANQDYVQYDNYRINQWNNLFNGCEIDSTSCSFDKIEIVLNGSLTTHDKFTTALQNGEYGISVIGLNPNFLDPLAYLESFSSDGELFEFLNHNESSKIENSIKEINKYYNEIDLNKRYELCAKLEYEIIFDLALALPLYVNDTGGKVVVSNLVPYQKMKSTYGLSAHKFKFRKLKEKSYTQSDIEKLREEYENGRINK